ncbi:hypothetical protein EJB05_15029, partial [Eragrostis curvula]
MLQGMRERAAKSREDAIKSEEDAQAIWKQQLERLENLLLRVQAREEAIKSREQEAERKQKNDNNWNRGPIVSMLLLVGGLMLLIKIRVMFPVEDLDLVAGGFAILWVSNSMTLFGGVFGRSRTLAAMLNGLFTYVSCSLSFMHCTSWHYLLMVPLYHQSPSQALTDGRSIVHKIITMVQDTFSWVLGT